MPGPPMVRSLRVSAPQDRPNGREQGGCVEQRNEGADSDVKLEESAERVLASYRERRRRRRGEDTYFGSAELVLEPESGSASGAEPSSAGPEARRPEIERRRVEILEDAEEEGMPPELAGLLYDIAREEGLDPGLGFELVRSGLGVAPPAEGVSTATDAPMVDKYLPQWMFPPEPTDHMLRERMLRLSFRRLRSMLRDEGDPDAALRRFAREPDVGHYGY